MIWVFIAIGAVAGFVLVSPRNTKFFVHRLAAHAAGLEAYRANFDTSLEMMTEHERKRQEELAKRRHDIEELKRLANEAGLKLTTGSERVQ